MLVATIILFSKKMKMQTSPISRTKKPDILNGYLVLALCWNSNNYECKPQVVTLSIKDNYKIFTNSSKEYSARPRESSVLAFSAL